MNNEIKVNLNITLKGRVMLSEQAAQNKPENYDSFSMEIADAKGKNRQRITVRTRKMVPAKQAINLNVDAYEAMISKGEVPYWIKVGTWVAMTEKQRLEAHLQRITEALGGVAFTYKVLEDRWNSLLF